MNKEEFVYAVDSIGAKIEDVEWPFNEEENDDNGNDSNAIGVRRNRVCDRRRRSAGGARN